MPINDFRIQLATAYPGARQIESKKGNTLLAELATDQGRKFAYVKLLSVENIAREAICSVLARKLYLPMLQPYYVSIDSVTLSGQTPGNAINVAFGVEADNAPTFQISTRQPEEQICKWQEALRLAAFDEWIFNTDRIPNNLLFAGEGHYWLIDHDEALPSDALPHTSANSQLLQLLSHDRSEFQLFDLRRKLRVFVQDYQSIDWAEIFELLRPNELAGSTRMFRRHIEFLAQRTRYLDEIFTESLGIKQRELNLESTTGDSSQLEK